MRNNTTLIFDLDGTITNPSLGIERCINYALGAHGYSEVSKDHIAAEIGPPLDETFQLFCPEADDVLILSLVAKYRERYAEIGYAENEVYGGIIGAIETLSSKGIPMGVCTSKRKDFAEKILHLFDLLKYFQFVDGGDVGIKKREQLAGLLRSNKIDSSSIMIGDREVDITSAKANGLRSIGVLWGFGDLDEISRANPDSILRDTSELAQLVVP